MIAVCRLRYCPKTRAYVERRTSEGKTKKGIIRCLKRYIAREVVCPRFRRHLTAWVERLGQGGVDATNQAALPAGVPA